MVVSTGLVYPFRRDFINVTLSVKQGDRSSLSQKGGKLSNCSHAAEIKPGFCWLFNKLRHTSHAAPQLFH